jgi:DNA-binding LytR/AlgR family response regulator
MKIAICDDDKKERDRLVSFFHAYSLQTGISFSLNHYENGFYLLDAMETGNTFDLIILDILMPGMNGIQTAKQIRHSNEVVKIIFLTSSSEFAVDSYAVGAYYYLLKPVEKNVFFEIIQRFLRTVNPEEAESIILHDGKSLKRILLSDLVQCEIQQRTILFKLANGASIQTIGTLSELERELLRFPYFTKPHRSYLVNVHHIKEITKLEITTDLGTRIPISRGRYDEISHAFLSQIFRGDER